MSSMTHTNTWWLNQKSSTHEICHSDSHSTASPLEVLESTSSADISNSVEFAPWASLSTSSLALRGEYSSLPQLQTKSAEECLSITMASAKTRWQRMKSEKSWEHGHTPSHMSLPIKDQTPTSGSDHLDSACQRELIDLLTIDSQLYLNQN